MFLPLAAGIFVATLCGYDPALELQLTLPTHYRRTVMYRLAIIGLWRAYVAIIASLILEWARLEKTLPLTSTLPLVLQWGTAQLTWLAPLLWFVANRIELLGTAVLFLLISWFQLHQAETFLQKTPGDE
jgi:hypothetical protein